MACRYHIVYNHLLNFFIQFHIKEYSEQEIIEIGLIENIQRENLNPIEEAMAFKRLLEEFNRQMDFQLFSSLLVSWDS